MTSSASSRYFSTEPIVIAAASSLSTSKPSRRSASDPADRLGDAGCLLHLERADAGHGVGDVLGQRLLRLGHPVRMISAPRAVDG